VVAVDGKDWQADTYILVLEVRSVLIAIQGDIDVHSFVAKHIILEHIETSKEALLAGVNLIEEITSQE
jgi:hypothetical protein